jgi:hypothetical protein
LCYVRSASSCSFTAGRSGRRERERERTGYVTAGLAALALASIAVTVTLDTSLDVNVTNNIYARVFPDKVLTEHFHERYGMPTGPFVAACAGGNVNTRCFDGEALEVRFDWPRRSYVLGADRYGFLDWVRTRGRNAWVRYLLWDDLGVTLGSLAGVFSKWYSGETVTEFIRAYLNYNALATAEPHYQQLKGFLPSGIGFFGLEPVDVTTRALRFLGFGNLYVVLAYMLGGLILAQMMKGASLLLLAVETMSIALVLFFLSFFGDAYELPRHLLPPILLFTLGALVYLAGVIQLAVSIWRRA